MVEGIEHLNLALCALNSSNTSKEDRTAFEGVLSNFRSQRSSLGAAVQILQLQRNPHHLDLAVFAAQTIRHRVCEDAFSLKEPERQQLRHLFISYLTTSPGVHNTAVLRQVCICLATLAAVESAGDIVTESTTWQLPLQHHIELFQLLAEEGCSDWRHVNVPGASSCSTSCNHLPIFVPDLYTDNSAEVLVHGSLPALWATVSQVATRLTAC